MPQFKYILLTLVAVIVLHACSPADGDFAGSEYMPDMGHSIAYEANVYTYYGLNTWDEASTISLKELANPKQPVAGTVPRGYAGVFFADANHREDVMDALNGANTLNSISVPVNGSVPYYYENTEEERTRATAEILENPFPITEDGLERGEELYNIFCGICHGEAGDGLGYLVADENTNAAYPAAPANFLLEEFLNASNGRYYHAIMYGKNVMGGYSDKISFEERWQVIHWIRALQAKELKKEYSVDVNNLNPEFGTPVAQITRMASRMTDEMDVMPSADQHDAAHGSDDHSATEEHDSGH
ncbi:MAG: cytochrome c [Saprospiraceae bacterium]|nr:cytochrome c [Saprospiraceae bacterium]